MWALPMRFPASAQLCPLTCTVLLVGCCNTPELTGDVACSTPPTLTQCQCGLGLKRKQVTTWSPFCAGRSATACRLMRPLPGSLTWMNSDTNYSVHKSVITTQNPTAVLLKVQPRTQNLCNFGSGLEIPQFSLLRSMALIPQRSHSVSLEIIQELQHKLPRAFGKARPLKF